MTIDASSLIPRVERLENQYHELSLSHAESMLMLETYMKKLNAMEAMLMEIKEWLQPDKNEWEKEARLNERIATLETSIGRFKIYVKWTAVTIGGIILLVMNTQKIELNTIFSFILSKLHF
jgi:hypothetical protein